MLHVSFDCCETITSRQKCCVYSCTVAIVPVLLNITLLPWNDVIISDGLVSITNIHFGRSYSYDFKEIYLNAKCNRKIIKSL